MSNYIKAVRKMELKARHHKPYGLRWCLFSPIDNFDRLSSTDEEAYFEFKTKCIVIIMLWVLLGGILSWVTNLFYADLFAMNMTEMTSAQRWQVFFVGVGPMFIYPPLIIGFFMYHYELAKKKSKLNPREIGTLNIILNRYPELVEAVGAWMKATPLCYGDLERIRRFQTELNWGGRIDEAQEARAQLDEESNQQLRAGPLGVFLEKQALNESLPDSSNSTQPPRL